MEQKEFFSGTAKSFVKEFQNHFHPKFLKIFAWSFHQNLIIELTLNLQVTLQRNIIIKTVRTNNISPPDKMKLFEAADKPA